MTFETPSGTDEAERLRAKYRAERDKRLRPDAIEQYVEPVGEYAHFVDDPYVSEPLLRPPLHDFVDVAIIGGGFGGLVTAARLKECGFSKVRIIEKAGDFGGTWYWNRYPGAMCDVESYIYLPLLEEIGYIPERKYSFAPEIRDHARAIARHYDLYADACLQTGVTGLRWDEAAQHWVVETDRNDQIHATYVAMALGPLNKPKLPGIPGLLDFGGRAFHTSRWDYAYTGGGETEPLHGLVGKTVGVIGTGATGIQCIPRVAESAEHLYVFQRTPSAVDRRDNRATDPAWASSLTPGWQKRRMDNFNVLVNAGEQDEDLVDDGWTRAFKALTITAVKEESRRLGRRLTPQERTDLLEQSDFTVMEQIRRRVDDIVEDPEVAAALKPWYHRFCKRPGFHDEFLPTFNRPNVTLVDTDGRGVDRITERGPVVGEREYPVDCLIFATGFEVGTDYTRRASYDVIGRNGTRLSEKWHDGLRTFHGLFSADFPNCFFLGMTQTGVTVNFSHMLDEQARHLAYVLQQVRRLGASTVEATPEAETNWVAEIRRLSGWSDRFTAECTPSFFNSEGRADDNNGIWANTYGAGPVKFFELLRAWRDDANLAGLRIEAEHKSSVGSTT